MPAFIAALLGGLISIVGTLIGKALVSLGIGIVVFKGIETTIDWAKESAVQSLFNLPAEITSLLAYMKVGNCINIVFSAMIVRMVLNGLTSDTVKRFIAK